MKLGLVTVLFKSDDMLPDFFKSLSIQLYNNFVLYIVDNSPSAETNAVLKHLNEQYPLIQTKHLICEGNRGVAAGNNIGIRTALNDGCEDLIILNNDIVFENPALFSQLISIASATNAAVVAPKIYFTSSNTIWYAGSNFIKWSCNIKHTGEFQVDNNQFKSSNTEYAPTCFVYVKKEVFYKVGLMDETYFVYVDDLDFMYRLRLKGFNIWYENDLVIQHKISQSTGGKFSKFSVYYAARNRIYFTKKFYSKPSILIVALYTFISLGYHLVFKEKKIQLLPLLVRSIFAGFRLKSLESASIYD